MQRFLTHFVSEQRGFNPPRPAENPAESFEL